VSVNLLTGATGTPTGTVAPTSFSVTAVGNGWWRVTMTVTATAAANFFGIYVANDLVNSSYAGTAGSGIYVWGAQLEAGAFATSYIPTVASTVTRSADVATMTGTNFSSWYNQTAGTFVASADVLAVAGTTIAVDVRAGTGNQNQITLYQVGSAPVFTVTSGSVSQATIVPSGTAAANTVFKLAAAATVNDFAATFNAGTVGTDTSGVMPVALDRCWFGSAAGTTSYLNGHIREIAYYNTRLPNTTLQALTT